MDLPTDIRDAAVSRIRPDGTPYRAIFASETSRLSARYGTSGKQVEIEALVQQVTPERYVRNLDSFSMEDQIRLLSASVAVAGLGGLGGAVAEMLAREGIGRLILIDGDRFDESNLNRQLFAAGPTMGLSKALAAESRLRSVNPSIEISAHNLFLTLENAETLLAGADVVVDCLDTIPARFTLEAASRKRGVPFVSAAVAGVAGHVTTVFPEDDGLSLIYGGAGEASEKGVEKTLGCMFHAVVVLAGLECAETVRILLKQGGLLRNRLLVMDLADYSFSILTLK